MSRCCLLDFHEAWQELPGKSLGAPTQSSDAAGCLLSPPQFDCRARTVDNLQRKKADLFSVDWSGAAGHVFPRAEMRASHIDDHVRRARSEPPVPAFVRSEVASAQQAFGVVPDSGRRRRIQEPTIQPSRSELAREGVAQCNIEWLQAKRHFHDDPVPRSSLSPRLTARALESLDIDAPFGRRHRSEATAETVLPANAATWDFPEAVGTYQERRRFFEQSLLADVYAANIGRPRSRAQPLVDEWKQTAEMAREHRRRGERERGWQVVGSWHRSCSARAAPISCQATTKASLPKIRPSLRREFVEAETFDEGVFTFKKHLSLGSASTASSSHAGRHHDVGTDDGSDWSEAFPSPLPSPQPSPRPSPALVTRSISGLSNIAESTALLTDSASELEQACLPRELRRVVSAVVGGDATPSLAAAAAQALQSTRSAGERCEDSVRFHRQSRAGPSKQVTERRWRD